VEPFVSRVRRAVSVRALVASVAACGLVFGCASDDAVETAQADDLNCLAPGEYLFTAEGFSVLPETIWLEPGIPGKPDWSCVGEMKPHLPETHRFRKFAQWGEKTDGSVHLVWANEYSGIRAELWQASPCQWEGFVTLFWNFPTWPQARFPARLECADD